MARMRAARWRRYGRPLDVVSLVAGGRIRPPIDRRFPLAQVAEALESLDTAAPPGKVLVTIPG